ncbi:MAG: 2-dehydropantoate 2-reductase [Rhodanobacter sp.]
MRILVVGAGATGGYFGGRLLEHGRDVTFLVHSARATALAQAGLVIHSPAGDAVLPAPPTVRAFDLHAPYDLILLSCKAYGLTSAMTDFAPAVGPQTAILPLLNGMQHLDVLDQRFGATHVLGGRCMIAATLDEQGAVQHLNRSHGLTFGERDAGAPPERMQAITTALSDAGFDARPSASILQDMWDKWLFLTALAGITCLMRASIGAIAAAPGGTAAALALLEECRAVAARAGHAPSERTLEHARAILTEAGSTLTASMLRDVQDGHAVEADHIVGDMLARADAAPAAHALLTLVYANLKAYEASRAPA